MTNSLARACQLSMRRARVKNECWPSWFMAVSFNEGQGFKSELVQKGACCSKNEFITITCLDSDNPGLGEASGLRQREIYRPREEVKSKTGNIPALDRCVAKRRPPNTWCNKGHHPRFDLFRSRIQIYGNP